MIGRKMGSVRWNHIFLRRQKSSQAASSPDYCSAEICDGKCKEAGTRYESDEIFFAATRDKPLFPVTSRYNSLRQKGFLVRSSWFVVGS